jgi:hypothetical protein
MDITLSGNTNYSAISPAPTVDDRILLNGFTLTIDTSDVYSTEITAAGNAGKIAFATSGGAYVFHGQNGTYTTLRAGTTYLWTETSANAARSIAADIRGGSVSSAYGVSAFYGTFAGGTLTGGSASSAHGVGSFYGTFAGGTLTGGSVSSAYGVSNFYGTVILIGQGAITDSVDRAISAMSLEGRHPVEWVVRGEALQAFIPAGVQRIRHIGPISPLATFGGTPEFIELVTGGATSVLRSRIIQGGNRA